MRRQLEIVVLVKQVPTTGSPRFDPSSRRLVRDGLELVVNAFDRRGMHVAARMRAEFGARVSAITMGPPAAREALVECLATGADEAVHLCDEAFAGADTLATARALATAIRRHPFDLIIAGQHSTDAETGQVGPEVAELLGIPQVTAVSQLTLEPGGRRLQAVCETDDGVETVQAPLPALVTVAERIGRPGLPPADQVEIARRRPITTLTAQDLGDPTQFGAAGSPTTVTALRSAVIPRAQRVLTEPDPAIRAAFVAGYLLDHLHEPRVVEHSRAGWPEAASTAAGPDVWALVEAGPRGLPSISFELLGRAKQLAAELGGMATAVVLDPVNEREVAQLAACGADRVLVADHPLLVDYRTDTHASALEQLIGAERPFAVLLPSTARGRDLAPRVAARLGLGLTGDAIGVDLEPNGMLSAAKPAHGGDVVATVRSRTRPFLATVRPGMLQPLPPRPGRAVRVEHRRVRLEPSVLSVLERTIQATDANELDSANLVVGVGMGLGREHVPRARALAEALGGALGGTRKVVDQGWLPRPLQIGISGRAVSPAVYLAFGISGGVNHTVGMRQSGTVIAVNSDPSAPIRVVSDLFVVADAGETLSALYSEIARRHGEGR